MNEIKTWLVELDKDSVNDIHFPFPMSEDEIRDYVKSTYNLEPSEVLIYESANNSSTGITEFAILKKEYHDSFKHYHLSKSGKGINVKVDATENQLMIWQLSLPIMNIELFKEEKSWQKIGVKDAFGNILPSNIIVKDNTLIEFPELHQEVKEKKATTTSMWSDEANDVVICHIIALEQPILDLLKGKEWHPNINPGIEDRDGTILLYGTDTEVKNFMKSLTQYQAELITVDRNWHHLDLADYDFDVLEIESKVKGMTENVGKVFDKTIPHRQDFREKVQQNPRSISLDTLLIVTIYTLKEEDRKFLQGNDYEFFLNGSHKAIRVNADEKRFKEIKEHFAKK